MIFVFRLIIAGGRDFNDYETLKNYVDFKLSRTEDEIQIISGGARGADTLGERYAVERGFFLRRFPADWERYGKSAGVRRNREMARNADALIAYWNGYSRGTKNMIEEARAAGIIVCIRNY